MGIGKIGKNPSIQFNSNDTNIKKTLWKGSKISLRTQIKNKLTKLSNKKNNGINTDIKKRKVVDIYQKTKDNINTKDLFYEKNKLHSSADVDRFKQMVDIQVENGRLSKHQGDYLKSEADLIKIEINNKEQQNTFKGLKQKILSSNNSSELNNIENLIYAKVKQKILRESQGEELISLLKIRTGELNRGAQKNAIHIMNLKKRLNDANNIEKLNDIKISIKNKESQGDITSKQAIILFKIVNVKIQQMNLSKISQDFRENKIKKSDSQKPKEMIRKKSKNEKKQINDLNKSMVMGNLKKQLNSVQTVNDIVKYKFEVLEAIRNNEIDKNQGATLLHAMRQQFMQIVKNPNNNLNLSIQTIKVFLALTEKDRNLLGNIYAEQQKNLDINKPIYDDNSLKQQLSELRSSKK